MAIRTGKEYQQGLGRKPRDVWINGEHITNVLDHPIFAASIKEIAKLYNIFCFMQLVFDLKSNPFLINIF